jgi:hypothetical protein
LGVITSSHKTARGWFTAALVVNAIYGMGNSLLAALWQHAAAATAAPMMVYLSSGAVTAVVGPLATTLVWLGFGLTLVPGVMCLRDVLAVVLPKPRDLYSPPPESGDGDGEFTDVEHAQGHGSGDAVVASGAGGEPSEAVQAGEGQAEGHDAPDIEMESLKAVDTNRRDGGTAET